MIPTIQKLLTKILFNHFHTFIKVLAKVEIKKKKTISTHLFQYFLYDGKISATQT